MQKKSANIYNHVQKQIKQTRNELALKHVFFDVKARQND